jgi:hypothetical protein
MNNQYTFPDGTIIDFGSHDPQKVLDAYVKYQSKPPKPESNTLLREAVQQVFEKRLDEAVKFINPKYTYHGSYQAAIDEILALVQAREQHCDAVPDGEPNDIHINYFNIGYEQGQQQLLTELLEHETMVTRSEFTSLRMAEVKTHAFEAVPTSVIKGYMKGRI